MRTKYIPVFIVLLFFLWATFIITALYSPIGSSRKGLTNIWLRPVDQVYVEIAGIDKSDLHHIKINRISPRGNGDALTISIIDEDIGQFSSASAYYSGLSIEVPEKILGSIKQIKVIIGSNKKVIAKSLIDNHFNVTGDHIKQTRLELKSDEFLPERSIVPYMDTVINYRGDAYLFGFSFLVSFFIVAGSVLILAAKSTVTNYISADTATILFFCFFLLSRLFGGLIQSVPVKILLDAVLVWLGVVTCIAITYFEDQGHAATIFLSEKKNKRIVGFLIGFTVISACIFYVFLGRSWLDDGKYFIRGYWYTSGLMDAYGPEDGNWYAPFFFYVTGLWQLIFNDFFADNLLSVRLLSTLFTFINCFLLTIIVKKLTASYFLTTFSILLYLATPFGFFYYNTVTPYAFISTISLLIWLLYLYPDRINWWLRSVFYGLGYIALVFTRRNMVLALPFLFIFQIASINKGYVKKISLTLLTVILVLVLIFSFFPKKLQHVMVGLPYINRMVYDMGILDRDEVHPSDPVTRGTLRDSLNNEQPKKSESHFAFFKTIYEVLWTDYAEHYLPFILANALSILFLVKSRKWKNPGLFAAVYFVFVSLAHALGSPGASSVRAYIHYVMVLGVIGIAAGLKKINDLYSRKKMINMSGILSLVVLILFWYPAALLEVRSISGSPVNYLKEFSQDLKSYRVQNKEVLVFDTADYDGVKAVHFAGGIPEPASLNLEFVFRRAVNNKDILSFSELERRNWWSKDLMEFWIEEKYDTVLLRIGDLYGEYWQDLIERNMKNSYPLHTPNGSYILYTR